MAERNLPPGVSTVSRTFQVAATAGAGSYDATWRLRNPGDNSIIDTRSALAYVWVNAPGAAMLGPTITSSALNTSTITLQNGVINRITGTFTINNPSATQAAGVLRLKIRPAGSTAWITDLAGDMLVTLPPGDKTFTRGFAIPRYLGNRVCDVSTRRSSVRRAAPSGPRLDSLGSRPLESGDPLCSRLTKSE